jgi:hypothetical protein
LKARGVKARNGPRNTRGLLLLIVLSDPVQDGAHLARGI